MPITTNKHYIKHIRIVDNTGYENYLEQGQMYGVLERQEGDIFSYYKLDVECPYKEGMWVSVGRCSDVEGVIELPTDVIPLTQKPKKSLEEAYDEPIPALDSERLREALQRWGVPKLQGGYIPSVLPTGIGQLPYVKPSIENIIEIPFPSDTSHGVDLYRVQYISPLDKGCYELTMGWMEKVKLTEEIYPRARMMAQWKAVRNK